VNNKTLILKKTSAKIITAYIVEVLTFFIFFTSTVESSPFPVGQQFTNFEKIETTGTFNIDTGLHTFKHENRPDFINQSIPFLSFISTNSKAITNNGSNKDSNQSNNSGSKWTKRNIFHITLLALILFLGTLVVWEIISECLYLKNTFYHKKMREQIKEYKSWMKDMKNKQNKSEKEKAIYNLMKFLKPR